MSQVSSYESVLYPKGAGELTENILPVVKDNSLSTHASNFGSKAVGGKSSKRKYKIKSTIIRKKKRVVRKTKRNRKYKK